ncbi:MAG: DUF167 domain-containing protein [Lysobacteraceae bacterium]
MPEWLSGNTGQWRLKLHVQPGAPATAVLGEHDGCLKLAVAAPPIDGRANDAIIKWFAKRLRLPRSALRISAGASGRRKTLLVEAELAPAAFEQLLRAA